MFTGASTADLAIVLVDARDGVLVQTRRHTRISALLGIRHFVACVNKMDLVGWDQDRFTEVQAQLAVLADRLEIEDLVTIPISALHGDNVATRSERTPWYDGPVLMEHLESVDTQSERVGDRLRLPIQWVGRPGADRSRIYTGRLAAGRLSVGDEVLVLPSGARTRVTSVDTLDAEADDAVTPMSVTVQVADPLDIGRGDMLVSPEEPPPIARELEVTVCWMADAPARAGQRFALKHTTLTTRATLQAIHHRWDLETMEREPDPGSLALNDIGRVTLRTSSPVLAESYAENRITGALILIDEHSNETVAAAIVREARPAEPPAGAAATSPGIRRRWTAVSAGRRPASAGRPCCSPGCRPRGNRPSRWPWSAR